MRIKYILPVIGIMTAIVLSIAIYPYVWRSQDVDERDREPPTYSKKRPFRQLSDEELQDQCDWLASRDKRKSEALIEVDAAVDLLVKELLNRRDTSGLWRHSIQSDSHIQDEGFLNSLCLFSLFDDQVINNRESSKENMLQLVSSFHRRILADEKVFFNRPVSLSLIALGSIIHWHTITGVPIPDDEYSFLACKFDCLASSASNVNVFMNPDDVYHFMVSQMQPASNTDSASDIKAKSIPLHHSELKRQIREILENVNEHEYQKILLSNEADWFIAACMFTRHHLLTDYDTDVHALLSHIMYARCQNLESTLNLLTVLPIALYYIPFSTDWSYLSEFHDKLQFSNYDWIKSNAKASFADVHTEELALRLIIFNALEEKHRYLFHLSNELHKECRLRRSQNSPK